MRLFYALWPDDATRESLSHLLHGVKGRRTRSDNLHITLAFLGNQPDSALPVLQTLLDELPATGFELTIDRLGYFNRQHIAWAGMQVLPDKLQALHEVLNERLQHHGIAYERRSSFKPHITLARNASVPEGHITEPILWHVGQVALVQSVTQPEGVSYQVLASRFLKAGDENT